MDINNEQETSEKPVSTRGLNAQGLTYEQTIAYFVVGKLVLDGAVDPRNFNFDETPAGVPYIVESIAESLSEGLAAYGYSGSLFKLIDDASLAPGNGTLHKGGAE